MRGLFTKIFLGFWIAQSVTFFISTMLIMRHRFVRPNEMMEVLNSTLPSTAAAAANAYEASGCPGLQQFARSLHQTVYLADSPSHFLCNNAGPSATSGLLTAADKEPGVHSRTVDDIYLWSLATQSASGQQYLFLLTRPRTANTYGLHELLFFANPQLPVAIVVFGATTFVLVLLLVRPIGRLRLAARKLANGELGARVDEPGGEERLFGGDEIQGLVHDFNYMAERLERLVGAQKILVRDVSHELRSPLARLSVALELAREEAPAAMGEHLQRIEREAGRLILLIGQLLRLSSMETTNASTPTETFRLQGLIEDLLPDAEFEAQQRSCTIRVVSHCECMVRGNTDLIYRAIENVVRNAVYYTQPGSSIEVRLQLAREGTQSLVRIAIRDFGPGVPESELINIFRPFYRVTEARDRQSGGVGLGLAIAERVIRTHGGTIQARNATPPGLLVEILLPECGADLT